MKARTLSSEGMMQELMWLLGRYDRHLDYEQWRRDQDEAALELLPGHKGLQQLALRVVGALLAASDAAGDRDGPAAFARLMEKKLAGELGSPPADPEDTRQRLAEANERAREGNARCEQAIAALQEVFQAFITRAALPPENG